MPLKIPVSLNSTFTLNLNVYRNAHYHTLNKAKVNFKYQIEKELLKLREYNQIKLTYVLYPQTNRKCDVSNICSIVDKFFSDALVEGGHIKDDNYTFIPEVVYKIGSVDPKNPRVEVYINELKEDKMKLEMKFTLDSNDIKEALCAYVNTKFPKQESYKIEFESLPEEITGKVADTPLEATEEHVEAETPPWKDTIQTEEEKKEDEAVMQAPEPEPVRKPLFGNLKRPE